MRRADSERRRIPSRTGVGLRALEWIFLLLGLLALDCFVWVNTSSVLYQAYEDWAFDQTLRGLTPSSAVLLVTKRAGCWSADARRAEIAEAPQASAGPPEPAASELRRRSANR